MAHNRWTILIKCNTFCADGIINWRNHEKYWIYQLIAYIKLIGNVVVRNIAVALQKVPLVGHILSMFSVSISLAKFS